MDPIENESYSGGDSLLKLRICFRILFLFIENRKQRSFFHESSQRITVLLLPFSFFFPATTACPQLIDEGPSWPPRHPRRGVLLPQSHLSPEAELQTNKADSLGNLGLLWVHSHVLFSALLVHWIVSVTLSLPNLSTRQGVANPKEIFKADM